MATLCSAARARAACSSSVASVAHQDQGVAAAGQLARDLKTDAGASSGDQRPTAKGFHLDESKDRLQGQATTSPGALPAGRAPRFSAFTSPFRLAEADRGETARRIVYLPWATLGEGPALSVEVSNIGIGVTPARSPITLINCASLGRTTLAFWMRARSTASSFRRTWALPMKYLSAASLTSWMAKAWPSASRMRACLVPSA